MELWLLARWVLVRNWMAASSHLTSTVLQPATTFILPFFCTHLYIAIFICNGKNSYQLCPAVWFLNNPQNFRLSSRNHRRLSHWQLLCCLGAKCGFSPWSKHENELLPHWFFCLWPIFTQIYWLETKNLHCTIGWGPLKMSNLNLLILYLILSASKYFRLIFLSFYLHPNISDRFPSHFICVGDKMNTSQST